MRANSKQAPVSWSREGSRAPSQKEVHSEKWVAGLRIEQQRQMREAQEIIEREREQSQQAGKATSAADEKLQRAEHAAELAAVQAKHLAAQAAAYDHRIDA